MKNIGDNVQKGVKNMQEVCQRCHFFFAFCTIRVVDTVLELPENQTTMMRAYLVSKRWEGGGGGGGLFMERPGSSPLQKPSKYSFDFPNGCYISVSLVSAWREKYVGPGKYGKGAPLEYTPSVGSCKVRS